MSATVEHQSWLQFSQLQISPDRRASPPTQTHPLCKEETSGKVHSGPVQFGLCGTLHSLGSTLVPPSLSLFAPLSPRLSLPLSFSPFPVSLVCLSHVFSIHSFPFPKSRKHQNCETSVLKGLCWGTWH